MNYDNIKERLEDLKIEDFIWIIYIGLIFLSWFANHLERDYFLNNNIDSKDKYRHIMFIIFLTLTIIYFYFVQDSYEDIAKIKNSDTDQKKILTVLSFIASLLILISGLIYLYIIIKDENIDVELAFN